MPTALVLLASLGAALLGPNPWLGGLWVVGSAWNFWVAAWMWGRWLRPGATGTSFWAGATPILWMAVTGLCLAPLAGPGLGFEAMALAQLGVGVLLGALTLGLLAVRLATSGVWSRTGVARAVSGGAPPAVCGLVAAQSGARWPGPGRPGALPCLRCCGRARCCAVLAQPIGLTFWAPAVSLALFAALTLRLAPAAGGLFPDVCAARAGGGVVAGGGADAGHRQRAARRQLARAGDGGRAAGGRRAVSILEVSGMPDTTESSKSALACSHVAAAAPHAALQSPDVRNDLLNRLRRAEGQLRGIQGMIERGRTAARSHSSFRRCAARSTARMCT